MKLTLKTLITAALLSCSALFAAGCAGDGHARSGGEVLDDSAITAKVKTALLAEPNVNALDINVTTHMQTVQLSGFVNSQWQIDKAGEIAASVGGVRKVTNDLVHKPG